MVIQSYGSAPPPPPPPPPPAALPCPCSHLRSYSLRPIKLTAGTAGKSWGHLASRSWSALARTAARTCITGPSSKTRVGNLWPHVFALKPPACSVHPPPPPLPPRAAHPSRVPQVWEASRTSKT
jgi:hypothetical protein